jgi:hypothetical protein
MLHLNSENVTPREELCSKEFWEAVMKFGSFVSMLENKKVNTTTLFSLLIENKNYQNIFVELTSCTNFREAIEMLLYLYPSLVKSKVTKSTVKRFLTNSNVTYQSRKAII